MKRLLPLLLIPLGACAYCHFEGSTPEPLTGRARPATWAQPVAVTGAPNLHKVTGGLYRSAQPTAEGMAGLVKLGIKTVVNLRTFHSDRDEIGKLPLRYEHITMQAWNADRQEAVRFLKILADPANHPVLVHCQHGADRTGTVCALYRITLQGWSKEEAIREMTKGGVRLPHDLGQPAQLAAGAGRGRDQEGGRAALALGLAGAMAHISSLDRPS